MSCRPHALAASAGSIAACPWRRAPGMQRGVQLQATRMRRDPAAPGEELEARVLIARHLMPRVAGGALGRGRCGGRGARRGMGRAGRGRN